jgi:hypothetical protein
VGPGFITGTGSMGYYKSAEGRRISASFRAKLNSEPLLCGGGDAGFDLRSGSDWKFWLGTPSAPLGVKVICKDFLSNTGYLQISNTGFAAGLSMSVSVAAQSPWIEISPVKFRGSASFQLGYSVVAALEWDPTFKINEASVSAWVSAAVGVEYEVAANTSTVTLAGVSLAGTLGYKSQPEAELHGALSGSITVVGYSLGFDTEVHYSLSRQKILD